MDLLFPQVHAGAPTPTHMWIHHSQTNKSAVGYFESVPVEASRESRQPFLMSTEHLVCLSSIEQDPSWMTWGEGFQRNAVPAQKVKTTLVAVCSVRLPGLDKRCPRWRISKISRGRGEHDLTTAGQEGEMDVCTMQGQHGSQYCRACSCSSRQARLYVGLPFLI